MKNGRYTLPHTVFVIEAIRRFVATRVVTDSRRFEHKAARRSVIRIVIMAMNNGSSWHCWRMDSNAWGIRESSAAADSMRER